MKDDWSVFLEESLKQRTAAGLFRTRDPATLGKGMLDFGSNDYLGLRKHPRVLSALRETEIVGSGSSPVLTGHTRYHGSLEAQLAEFVDTEDALVFSSGFSCHSGVIACLAGTGDLILSDQLNHASLIDGCRLSRAQVQIFPHNDVDYVESFLRQQRDRYRKVMLLTETVFSMDGDCAPLTELAKLCSTYNAGLVVDEAHAMGLFGERGSGLAEELQLGRQILAKLGTLSKAAGVVGGYVCGSKQLIAFVVNFCRSYIFSTAPPVPIVKAARVSLELVDSMRSQRLQLRSESAKLRRNLTDMGWDVPAGESPIIPIIVGSAERAQAVSQALVKHGIYVPAIRPPTVPEGTSRLRVSLSASHTSADVEQLTDCLSRLVQH